MDCNQPQQQLVEDLQATKIEAARVERLNIEKLHWSLHFFDQYPNSTETEHDINVRTPFGGLAGAACNRLQA